MSIINDVVRSLVRSGSENIPKKRMTVRMSRGDPSCKVRKVGRDHSVRRPFGDGESLELSSDV